MKMASRDCKKSGGSTGDIIERRKQNIFEKYSNETNGLVQMMIGGLYGRVLVVNDNVKCLLKFSLHCSRNYFISDIKENISVEIINAFLWRTQFVHIVQRESSH